MVSLCWILARTSLSTAEAWLCMSQDCQGWSSLSVESNAPKKVKMAAVN
jgi:hypothetical protein